MDASHSSLPHVVVIGGGFAGLWCTRALARDAVRITLIDRTNHHLFQPLLYQVATAGLSSPDIAAPLRHILRRQRNVEVRLGEVVGIDPVNRSVKLADGTPVGYDYLLVASGATHSYFGHDEWASVAPGLKTLDDALAIRRRVLTAFERAESASSEEERDAWLSFVIVGGGPTGVELAGTLAEIARHTLKREFRHIDPARATVRLIEAGPRVLASFPESLSEKARAQLARLGVTVLTGAPVKAIDAAGVEVGETRIASKTVLWAAGVAASTLGAELARTFSVDLDRAGRVKVKPDLSVDVESRVYVAGDLAHIADGARMVPGVAPAAKQMGAYVANAIRASLRAERPQPFKYQDFGNLATIGRLAAIVDLRGLKFSGPLAWAFWLLAHVFFLIGFRNRLVVMLNWAWSYWTYQRSARIILGGDSPRPDRNS